MFTFSMNMLKSKAIASKDQLILNKRTILPLF